MTKPEHGARFWIELDNDRLTESEYMTAARCRQIPAQLRAGQENYASASLQCGLVLARHGEARGALIVAAVLAGLGVL